MKLIIGAGLTYLVFKVVENLTEKEENKEGNGLAAAALAAFGFFAYDESQKNTVNYTLYRKGKRVYDGITKASRKQTRIAEHRASGKQFDKVRFSRVATYRSAAMEREERLINRHKPEYNIQHNGKL